MADPTRDRRAVRHEATKREILEASWALAAEHGLTGWSLKDVAQLVGMRTPSLYVYFDSKAALYDALYADGYAQLRAEIEAAVRPADPVAVLRSAARMFVDFCAANPSRFQLLFLRTIPGFQPSESSFALAVQTLDAGREALVDAGADRPEDLDLWTALLTGLATQQISNDVGGSRWRRLTDDAVDMFVAARLAPQSSQRR